MKNNQKVQQGQQKVGLMSPRDLAARLGMSYEFVRKMLQRRQIAFVRLGRSVRIHESEADRLIMDNLVPARHERVGR